MMRKADDSNARLRQYLRQQGFKVGDQIPGERDLAASLSMGRAALRPVMEALEREGILQRRPQAGTFLAAIPTPHGHQARVALIAPFGGTGEPGRETDPIWLYRVVSAFERTAVPAGLQIILKDQSPHGADPCSIKQLAAAIAQEGVGAAILLHPLGTREKISCALALLHDQGVHPLVVSSRTYPGLASQVYFDSCRGAYMAIRYLLKAGHQRIGFAGGPGGHEWVKERIYAYRSALEAADIECLPEWVWQSDTTERLALPQDGAGALEYWLSLPEHIRPTGILAANDVVALGFLTAAQERGLQIPDDLSLIGFDNDPGALLAGLTTIERPTEALGEAVARVTLERLAAGAEADLVTTRLRPVLIERSTVAPPRVVKIK
ncbi:MAG: substrate-binding domain-containing protein [Abitibacteriaceae bacterium]|nr:substrate-binding domain-containing protein [Abditibacteriaceae bacterium]